MASRYRPLTLEELEEASEIFFPRFNMILERMPEKATIQDTLNVMTWEGQKDSINTGHIRKLF